MDKHLIYKYRDWSNDFHKKWLTKNEIFFSSPNSFNDPFDCRIPTNFKLLTKEEKDQYITDLAIKGFTESERLGIDLSEAIKNLENRLENIAEFQQEANRIKFSFQDKYIGVASFSLIWNSILMWSHYAKDHTGICIAYDRDKLQKTGIAGKLGQVVYENEFPQIKPKVAKKPDMEFMEESFIQTHTKAKNWEYEQEYRMTNTYYPYEVTNDKRIAIIPSEIICGVILGIRIKEEDRNEIIPICKSKGIPIWQAIISDFEFKITRERLN